MHTFGSLLARCRTHCAKRGLNVQKRSYFYSEICFTPQLRALSSSTSQSAPTMRYFEHFGFEMCFPSQGRALVQHLNFQECYRTGVFCTFRVAKTLRLATLFCLLSLSSLTLPTSCLLNVLQLLVTAKD